jgi:hypothetical protein
MLRVSALTCSGSMNHAIKVTNVINCDDSLEISIAGSTNKMLPNNSLIIGRLESDLLREQRFIPSNIFLTINASVVSSKLCNLFLKLRPEM